MNNSIARLLGCACCIAMASCTGNSGGNASAGDGGASGAERESGAAGDFGGSLVSMGHYVPTDLTPYDGPYAVRVIDDSTEDRKVLTPFLGCAPGYGVNVEASSVVVDFVADVNFTAGDPFHGLIITNLVRPGATASVAATGPYTDFSYDGAVLKLDWQGNLVPSGSTYTITITPGTGTPAPTVCTSLGTGVCTIVDAGADPICPDAETSD